MRKTAAFLILLLFSLTVSVSAQSDTRTMTWKRWDVAIDQIDLNANSFRVTEIQRVQFGGTFRGGEQAIDTTRLESLSDFTVQIDGETLRSTSCRSLEDYPPPGSFCVIPGFNETIISYEFPAPVRLREVELRFIYTVSGALRVYDGGDQLWWTAVNSDRPGSVNVSTVTVEMPDGFTPREGIDPIEVYGAPGDITLESNLVTAMTVSNVRIGEEFSIRVQYPHNPQTPQPAWQNAFDRQQERLEVIRQQEEQRALERARFEREVVPLINVGIIAATILLGLGGVLVILTVYLNKGRKPATGPVPEYLTEPPVNVPPAVAGTIIDGITHVRDLLSTLIDLARRGYAVIEEDKNSATQATEFTFKRTDKPDDDLDSYEKEFLTAIFRGSDERKLTTMRESFYAQIPVLTARLQRHLIDQGYINSAEINLRSRWASYGTRLLMFAGGVLFFVPVSRLEVESYVANLINAGILVTVINGAALLLFSRFVSDMPLTRKGAEAAAKSNAFFEYLENIDKLGLPDKAADQFDLYLPYAVAFGFENTWVSRFRHLPEQPIPTWYYPVYRGGVFEGGYRRGTPHPWTTYRDMQAGKLPPGGIGGLMGGDPGKAGVPDAMPSLDSLSKDLSGGLNNISSGLTGMLNSASSAFTSRPAPPPSNIGGWSDSGGFDWSSSRGRTSGYRPTNTGGFRSGSFSGGGRSFSGGGSRRGSSGGGRSRFR
jgi:uncharacterized membrane protein YgcG